MVEQNTDCRRAQGNRTVLAPATFMLLVPGGAAIRGEQAAGEPHVSAPEPAQLKTSARCDSPRRLPAIRWYPFQDVRGGMAGEELSTTATRNTSAPESQAAYSYAPLHVNASNTGCIT